MAERKKRSKAEAEIDRLPPHSEELEQSVLGAIMMDPGAFGKVIEVLDEDCFYKPAHQTIFRAMIALFEKNSPIDMLTVVEQLKSMNALEEVGGAYYISTLMEMVSSTASIEHYSKMLLEKYLLRQIISVSGDTLDDCYRPETQVAEALDKAQERLFELSARGKRRGFLHITPVMHSTFEMLEKFHQRQGAVIGIATGFTDLDTLTSGFQNSDLIIIAARPSMGKTALALNIAYNIAMEKIPLGFFSLEMNAQMLAYRMLCSAARIDSHRVRMGRLKDAEWTMLGQFAGDLATLPIYIDDSSNLSVLELRARARRLVAEKGVGAIVIDYLQIMQPPPDADSQQQAIAAMSRQLKGLSKELDIPVVVLSQLSRAVETRGGDKRPQLSDLRDSGAIEQDADLVMFIWRPAVYKVGKEEVDDVETHKAEIIVAKQRNGPTGKIELVFNREYARFDNVSKYDGDVIPIREDFEEEGRPF
jgi:replicative DNA helicase